MSMFDPQAFLDSTITEEAVAFVVPADEYLFMIEPGSAEMLPWQSKDGSKSGWKLRYKLTTYDSKALGDSGRDKATCNYDLMLDTDTSGMPSLTSGSSIRNFREAIGMNAKGSIFSPRMAEGRNLKGRVEHRAGDAGQVYWEVKRVIPA